MARKRKSKKGSAKKKKKATNKRSAKTSSPKKPSAKKSSPKKPSAKKSSPKRTPAKKRSAKKPTVKADSADKLATSAAIDDQVEVIDLDAELAALDDREEPTVAEPIEEPAPAETEVETIDLGADTTVEVYDLDDETDVEVVDLDRELEAEDDTERLIAETLAIAESAVEESPSEDEAPEASVEAAEEAYAMADGPDPDAAAEAEGGSTDSPELVISADAVVALSAIHREGLASVPEELILDLGEAATEDERDQLLRAAMAHAEMREAVYRVSTDVDRTTARVKGFVAAVVMIGAMIAWGRPPAVVVPDPPRRLTTADREHGVRTALLLQAQQIEAFRARSERLPNSLAEVPVQLPGVRFVKSSNRLYQLIAYLPDGEAVVYDSATPDPDFEAMSLDWLSVGGGS